MNVYYWTFIWIIASYLPITARNSKEETVPVCFEGDTISPSFFQYSSNTPFLALQQAWIEARKEEDPDYINYYVRVFVKLPQKNSDTTILYKWKEVKNLKRTKLKKLWKKIKRVSTCLTCKFEAELREAEITFTDRTNKKSKEYQKVYDFKTTIGQIKEYFLRAHYQPAAGDSFLTKEEIVVKYYFVFKNTVYTLEDTLSIGRLAYHFNIKEKKPLLRLDIERAPIPPPDFSIPQYESDSEEEVETELLSSDDRQDDSAHSIEKMASTDLGLLHYTPLAFVAAGIGWLYNNIKQSKKRFKKHTRDKSV